MKIAIMMMQKNERLALPIWLKYHESLVGSASIYLFDNGSTHQHVLRELDAAETRGVHVYREHTGHQAFIDKGEIFTRLIHQLDATELYDFYFPLDCDEFLACLGAAGPECHRGAIEQALTPYLEHPGTLRISHKYWANPLHQNRYQLTEWSRKYFFAHGSCGWMDHGFHHAGSRSGGDEKKTPIIYFEFHFKPYRDHRRGSKEKLLPFHRNLSRRSLREYAAKLSHSHHCANELLHNRFSYLKQFAPENYPISDSTLLETLKAIGARTDRLFEPLPPGGWRAWRGVIAAQARISTQAADIRERLEDGLRFIRRGLRWLALRVMRG